MNDFNRELFSKLLIKAKGDRSINQYAIQCEINKSYISSLINMKKENPPLPKAIEKISKTAQNNVTYNELMEAAGYYEKNITDKAFSSITQSMYKNINFNKSTNKSGIEDLNNTYILPNHYDDAYTSVPLLKEIKADINLFDNKNIDHYEYVKRSESNLGSFFYITVPDNSMKNSRIRKGDLAYIKQQSNFTNGNIVLALINDEFIIRKLYTTENTTVLIPDNSNYDPLVITANERDTLKLKLIGKVIHVKFYI